MADPLMVNGLTPRSRATRAMQQLASAAVFVGLVLFAGAFFVGGALALWHAQNQAPAYMADELKHHFAAVVGLPSAALLALWIVMFLEQRADGTLKMKGLGFELEGGSGQIVLWVIVFLAITTGIRVAWSCTT
jgi:hypothetical protein